MDKQVYGIRETEVWKEKEKAKRVVRDRKVLDPLEEGKTRWGKDSSSESISNFGLSTILTYQRRPSSRFSSGTTFGTHKHTHPSSSR